MTRRGIQRQGMEMKMVATIYAQTLMLITLVNRFPALMILSALLIPVPLMTIVEKVEKRRKIPLTHQILAR